VECGRPFVYDEARLTLFAVATLLWVVAAALVLTLLTIAAAFLITLAALTAAARLLIRADLGLAGLLRGALLLAGLTPGLIFLGLLIAALLLTQLAGLARRTIRFVAFIRHEKSPSS
jgi:hypothetical protein